MTRAEHYAELNDAATERNEAERHEHRIAAVEGESGFWAGGRWHSAADGADEGRWGE